MRSRSVRLTFVILLILGVALAALGFRSINIDIPGLPAPPSGWGRAPWA